jgi:DMSO/TMAO reductase YedYZ molybdopterin-dependent catalytic subunit
MSSKKDFTVRTTMDSRFELHEIMMAGRNQSAFSELLCLDVTPIESHYQLVHFDVPVIDVSKWSLNIEGEVARPLELSLEDLRAMKRVEVEVTLECAGNGRSLASPRWVSQPWITGGVSTARWAGVRLADVLDLSGLTDEARYVVFTGVDEGIGAGVLHPYARSLSLEEALDGPLLAFEMNGVSLPVVHGFPLRLVCPGWYGMASVKWLKKIRTVRDPEFLPQQDLFYRIQRDENDPGVPVTRILPRSLIVPPGVPDEARARHVQNGSLTVTGRAWSGYGEIVRVEVSDDEGENWKDAEVSAPNNAWAWQKFQFEWEARPGTWRLRSRATDSAGNTQPLSANWNVQGMANNMVTAVELIVT